jgi:MFS family permease
MAAEGSAGTHQARNLREHAAGKLLLIACGISFISFLGSYMRIPVVPLFAISLGADAVQVGLINSGFMLVAGALSIPSGLISDRFGRRLPLLGGLMLLAISSILLYWSSSPRQMGVIYLLFGVGLSAFSPTLMSYVADVTPPEILGRALGLYTMALYGGMTIGPAAGGFLGKVLGLRPVFLVAGGLILSMFFVALFFLPSSTSHAPVERPAVLPALRGLVSNRRLIACLVATVGGCFGFGMFITFMPLYIRSYGMHSGDVGFVFASQALANALSRLPSGRMIDRMKDSSAIVAAGMLVFASALAAFALCHSLSPMMAMAAIMGGSMGIVFTAVCALIADSVPRQLRGLAMGCYNTSVYAGMMLSAAVLGKVISGAGFASAFGLTGIVGLIAMALFMGLFRSSGAMGR